MSEILVTGAGGMLGQAVVRAATRAGRSLQALARGELDVTDTRAVAAAVERCSPQTILSLAAWTDVDGAESDPEGALAVNGAGAANVASAAAAVGAHVIHVSTDYVFDGSSPEAYVESDATGPRSAYGRSKLAGEQRVATSGARFAIVRTAWLFGAGGRNFVDTMLRLAAEGRSEVAVVDDQFGCPTWTDHLAAALLEIADAGSEGIMHIAAAGSCSWNELARETFAQAALDVRVTAVSSAETDRPAPRPANSVLRSERPDTPRLPDWREGLRAHLARRTVAVAGDLR